MNMDWMEADTEQDRRRREQFQTRVADSMAKVGLEFCEIQLGRTRHDSSSPSEAFWELLYYSPGSVLTTKRFSLAGYDDWYSEAVIRTIVDIASRRDPT
jgi:hypothetical protein